jgi:predicted phosphoribosyltransferase
VIHDLPELRDREQVFRDRPHAGAVLARMLRHLRSGDILVLAIPAGGVPVAAEIARRLGLRLDVAVVSKITLPWNTEVGYGAVAFDGTVRLNQPLVASVGLSEEAVRAGIDATTRKIARRVSALRAGRESLDLSGASLLLVDDGLASGFTMRAAVAALSKAGPESLAIAVPTGSRRAVEDLSSEVDDVWCPNVRARREFAVADAYEHWSDVAEEEAATTIARLRSSDRLGGRASG